MPADPTPRGASDEAYEAVIDFIRVWRAGGKETVLAECFDAFASRRVREFISMHDGTEEADEFSTGFFACLYELALHFGVEPAAYQPKRRQRETVAKVLEIVQQVDDGLCSSDEPGDVTVRIAERIRTAFPAPASAAAEREEGAE